MKRGLALLVAILCYFCTYSQEVNTSSNAPEFVVTPRFDLNPYAPIKGGYSGFDFGNSSLYTFLDGEVGNFSYSLCNHWFSSDWESTKGLYQNAFYSYECDFIDWLTLSYQVGRFGFTIGKDMLALGTWELDYYDVDVHSNLVSPFWHKIAIYQWGGEVNYTTKDESTMLRFQFGTSPSLFGERPFTSNLFVYSLYWRGEYGCFSPIWSVNFMENEPGKFVNIIALGNAFSMGNFTLEVDYMNRASSAKRFFNQEFSIGGQLLYNHNDKVEIFVKGGYENYNSDFLGYEDSLFVPTDHSLCPRYWYAGGGVHYFPLRESRDLRIHAVAAYNNFAKSVSFTLGAVYHFNLTQTILKNRK